MDDTIRTCGGVRLVVEALRSPKCKYGEGGGGARPPAAVFLGRSHLLHVFKVTRSCMVICSYAWLYNVSLKLKYERGGKGNVNR